MVKAQSSTNNNGASQTKRLCVRNSSTSDDFRHKPLVEQQGQQDPNLLDNHQGVSKMTASINLPAQDADQNNKSQLDQSSTSSVNADVSSAHTLTSIKHVNGTDCNRITPETYQHELTSKLLASNTSPQCQIDILVKLRDLISACNKKKDILLNNPAFIRIVDLLEDSTVNPKVKAQVALLLCSMAKIKKDNLRILIENNITQKVLTLIMCSSDDELLEASVRCLRSFFTWTRLPEDTKSILYTLQTAANKSSANKEQNSFNDTIVPKLIHHALMSKSATVKECVADILSQTCQTEEQQNILCNANVIACILKLFESPSHRVVIASLNLLAQLCYKNKDVSIMLSQSKSETGENVLQKLIPMMDKSKFIEMRFVAAKCYAYIYRASYRSLMHDDVITKNVLPTLVRMVHRGKPPLFRIKAAECISYFVEEDPELQSLASIYDNLIESLANMLDYEWDSDSILMELNNLHPQNQYVPLTSTKSTWSTYTQTSTLDLTSISPLELYNSRSLVLNSDVDDDPEDYEHKMSQAAFSAIASLSASKEDIRKKVTSTCSIMSNLVRSLSCPDTNTLKAALCCLISLSRSVHALRTSFADVNLQDSIKSLLSTKDDEVMQLVLTILCNLSLDFSSVKQHFTDKYTIKTLCEMTKHSDPMLRLHSIWVLMNLVYEVDQNFKFQIFSELGMEQIFKLLSEDDEEILMKTLGFLRNLISQRPHIDAIMEIHGKYIMRAVTFILDSNRSCATQRVKEQAICVLANIADGPDARSLIMSRDDILQKLIDFIGGEKSDLELAAIYCVGNLAWKGETGYLERHRILKKYGIVEKLRSRINTDDRTLAYRVKTAYNQFMDLI